MLKRFGSHYAIERFGVIFVSLMTCMCILIGFIFSNKIRADHKILTGQAIYTQSFTMSLSGDSCSIKGLYVSDDLTKCYIPLQFSSMDGVPMDANGYEVFVTGSDTSAGKQELQSHPEGRLYVFGDTGLCGLYLYNPGGFPSQIMAISLQAKQYSGANAGSGEKNVGRFFVNPGGTFATHAEFLNKADWSVSDMYEETEARNYERVIRNNLRNTLLDMRNQRLVISDSLNRLEQYSIMRPDLPEQVAGDKIYGICPDDSDSSELEWSTQINAWFNPEDQNEQYTDDYVHLYLNPKYVLSGGYNFNWQNRHVRDGFLKELTGSDSVTDWDTYFDKIESDVSDDEMDLSEMKYYYTNGKEFLKRGASEDDGATSRETNIANTIKKLEDACTAYYMDKATYQRDLLSELLKTEAKVYDITENYTCNTGDDDPLMYYY